jgi:5-methylcytosine-specific restriction endonuclease McrA
MRTRKKTSVIWTTEKETLQKMLDESSSIVEVLIKLGFNGYNGNFKTLKQRIDSEQLDLSLFEINKEKHRLKNYSKIRNKKDNYEVFTENSNFNRNQIKKRLINDFGFDYICSECGLGDYYNNKPITLQLDHINGVNNDNRLENLRFLCPNCHSQTETFGGKSLKKYSICSCGNNKHKESSFCKNCYPKDRKKKILWPSPEEIKNLVWLIPTSQLAKNLGVSDVAINKFCKRHKIDKPSRGFWTKTFHSLKNGNPDSFS